MNNDRQQKGLHEALLPGLPGSLIADKVERSSAYTTGSHQQQTITLGSVIDAYMMAYTGRDRLRVQRLSYWRAQLGNRTLSELDDDTIFHHLKQIAAAPARLYAGVDADGKDIHRTKATARTASTVNRYQDAISSVLTWAIAERLAPKK